MGAIKPVTTAPAKGTRPRNRRQITIAAATELFHRHGYANVSMNDIAAATNVGASSIYRHFPSKGDLLVAAIEVGLQPYLDILLAAEPGANLPAVFRALARGALDHRAMGVLWQRDARALDPVRQRVPRAILFAISGHLASHLITARPELDADQAGTLSWCVMGALVSIGFHAVSLPREAFVELLADLCLAIADVRLPDDPGAATPVAIAAREGTRRDALITEASELFAERGYAAAGLGQIGDAAGIAGPSVYGHFASKQDLLVAVVERGTRELDAVTDVVLLADLPAAERLGALIDTYITSMNQNRFTIRILLSEMGELPPVERAESRRVQRQYIDTWVALLRELTGADYANARIRVQAALLVTNDAMQTPHIRARPGFEATINRIARGLLRFE